MNWYQKYILSFRNPIIYDADKMSNYFFSLMKSNPNKKTYSILSTQKDIIGQIEYVDMQGNYKKKNLIAGEILRRYNINVIFAVIYKGIDLSVEGKYDPATNNLTFDIIADLSSINNYEHLQIELKKSFEHEFTHAYQSKEITNDGRENDDRNKREQRKKDKQRPLYGQERDDSGKMIDWKNYINDPNEINAYITELMTEAKLRKVALENLLFTAIEKIILSVNPNLINDRTMLDGLINDLKAKYIKRIDEIYPNRKK